MSRNRNHPYHKLKIPTNAPFELKTSPGKGWGAFATRRISRGALILSEKPIFIIRKAHHEITEADIAAALQQLTPRKRNQFRDLCDNASAPFQTLLAAFDQNYFDISRGTSPTLGLCLLHARINHSCVPNSTIPCNSEEVTASYATSDIEAGQEITFCHGDFERRSRAERHEVLGFSCSCKACDLGTPFQVLSDLRRVFIRGLQFLTIGRDLDGQPPPILDDGLKKRAQEFRISLSNRFVYGVLILCLLEEEGLLDEFLEKRLMVGVERGMRSFEDVENRRLARLAMEKERWRDRFCVALRLWGRVDGGDWDFVKGVRMMRDISLSDGLVDAVD